MQICSLKKYKKNGITFEMHHESQVLMAGPLPSASGFTHRRDAEGVAGSLTHDNRKEERSKTSKEFHPHQLLYITLNRLSCFCFSCSQKPLTCNVRRSDCATVYQWQQMAPVESQPMNDQKLNEIS